MTWIGSVYKDLYPGTFIAAVKGLLESGQVSREDLRIRFVGTFDVESLKSIEESGLGDVVEMTGFMGHRECIRRMRSSRVLLQQLAEGRMSEILYTGKMFEYFGSRRPILALVGEGATADLMRESGAGVVVRPSDVEGIQGAIMDFYARYRAEDDSWVDNPDLERYDRKRQTGMLAEIFDRLR
jgi:glycosyltransferase involved in cell wall biosynthesis